MSGLAGVLAGRHNPGVYRWHGNFDAGGVPSSQDGGESAHLSILSKDE